MAEKKKNRKRKGCLGFFLIIFAAVIIFLLWPLPEDESVLFNEKFDNNNHNWVLSGGAVIENGCLFVPAGDGALIMSGLSLVNGCIEADLMGDNENTAVRWGLVFRGTEDQQGIFLIDANQTFYLRIPGEKDNVSEKVSFINRGEFNHLKLELYNQYCRIYINDNLLTEFYDKNPQSGSVALFSGGEGPVRFDNLKITDFGRIKPDITGKVIFDNTGQAGIPVTVWQVLQIEPLQTAVAARMETDEKGEYRFYLPQDFGYFVSAQDTGRNLYGDRYADLQVPDAGNNLDIILKEGARP